MNILALDLGTHTGWAASYVGRESGTQTFDVRRGESPGMRYIRFRAWLSEMCLRVRPRVIAYEQTHQRGGAATEIAAGFATRVQETAAELGIEHVALHTATLKKHATGSGRAGKPEMVAAARRRWPDQKIETEDQADALCLLAWAEDQYLGTPTPTGGD